MGSGRRSLVVLGALALIACGDGGTGPEIDDQSDTTIAGVDLHAGYIGLIADVREIFKRGYYPAEAEIAFPDHRAFETTLTVDPLTNLAILRIENDSLTENERAAFAAGAATTIVVYDSSGAVLANFSDDELVLDDSNEPLSISNPGLEYSPPPIALDSTVPYLLQIEGQGGLVTQIALRYQNVLYADRYERSGNYPDTLETATPSPTDTVWHVPGGQTFYFTPVTLNDSTYYEVRQPYYDFDPNVEADSLWCVEETPGGSRYLALRDGNDDASCLERANLIFEQDDDGWLRMRRLGTSEYVKWRRSSSVFPALGRLTLAVSDIPNSKADADRFRLLSDDIVWDFRDRGMAFNQPITPPTELDLAYQTSVRNCSAAEVTEEIGRTQSRTTTISSQTTESIQIFRQNRVSIEISAEFKVGVPTVGDVTVSAKLGYEFTKNRTTTEGTTVDTTNSTEVEVSRTRTVQLQPYTAIKATDLIFALDQLVIPWTQQFRITAYQASTGRPLSGDEIRTQMRFNLTRGLVTRIGADFVDISVRGSTTAGPYYKAESTVEDIPGACS